MSTDKSKTKEQIINLSNLAISERRTFVIENIPTDIYTYELKEAIEYYCSGVVDVHIPFSPKSQMQMTRAFIIMENEKDTEFLIRKFENYKLNGKYLKTWLVNEFRKY